MRAAALPLVVVGSSLAFVAEPQSRGIDLGAAGSTSASVSAPLVGRGDLVVSRSGERALVGADRIEAVQARAARAIREQRARAARQAAREEARERAREARERAREAREQARERAREERRQEILEARQWGPPVESYSVTATFGQAGSLWSSGVHTGVDLNASTGTPVRSVGPGTVTSAGYDGSYGYKIVVAHDDGTETWYCHLSAINVSVGSTVTNATVIGLVGATGNVTGDHLHLELRSVGGGAPLDPVAGLAARGVSL